MIQRGVVDLRDPVGLGLQDGMVEEILRRSFECWFFPGGPPAGIVDHGKHGAGNLAVVRHTGMPQSQVSQHQAAGGYFGLHRGPDSTSGFYEVEWNFYIRAT